MTPPPDDGRAAASAERTRTRAALPAPSVRVASERAMGCGRVRRPSAPAQAPLTADGAVPDRLIDRYGRTVRDLRLSITDRCNLRCTYCMPAAGLAWLPGPSLLEAAEIARLARLAVERLGIERPAEPRPASHRGDERVVAWAGT